jgi:hypothetical protein
VVNVRRFLRAAAALIVALAIPLALSHTALALDDDEFNGYAADTLTIRVGYFGGPYYDKAVFTLDELWAMDVVYSDYTFIDNMPSVVIDHIAGVTLADIMSKSGIDLGSVQNFNFWTNDKTGDYYVSLTKEYLIDTPRYCYYSLPDNFDYDEGEGNEYATVDAVRVPTVLALADDWNRSLAGASFGSDYLNLNTNTRFRLIFGQTDARERTASRSAKWVHSIEVTLGGAPTVTLDKSVLELEVGSLFRTSARVSSPDEVLSANAQIEWSSSDDSTITVDGDGSITVKRAGVATVTARVGGSTASIVVTGVEGEKAPDVPVGSANNPTGTGDGGTNPPTASGGSPGGSPGGVPGGTPGGTPDVTPSGTPDGAISAPTRPDTPAKPASEPKPAAPLKAAAVGYEMSILPPPTGQAIGGEGGVQNWRGGEMSPSAVQLPIIESDTHALAALAVSSVALILLGGAYELYRYKKETR